MDATAMSLCMENRLPIIVFNVREDGNIRRAVAGEPIGTLVHGADAMTVETALKDADDKMDKAIAVLKDEFAGVRTGRATPASSTASSSTTTGRRPRSTSSRRSACPSRARWSSSRSTRTRWRDGEGDPVERPRHHPEQRRQRDPTGVPAAHRGAAQGADQGRAPPRRGGPGCRSEHPPALKEELERLEQTAPSPKMT